MTCDRLPVAARDSWTLWVRSKRRRHWLIVTWHADLAVVDGVAMKLPPRYEYLILPPGEHPIEARADCHRPINEGMA